jgi:hypothetical protein
VLAWAVAKPESRKVMAMLAAALIGQTQAANMHRVARMSLALTVGGYLLPVSLKVSIG